MADSDMLGAMNPVRSPETIQNMDILDLVNRIDAYCQEFSRCASATRCETSQHDLRRSRDVLARFRERFELYAGDPELDLPKYHPEPLRLPVPPALNRIENADLQQILNMWIITRIELAFSDSAERASGFKSADIERIRKVMEKIDKTNAAIEGNPEIDLPDVDVQEPPAQSPLRA